MGKHPAPTAHVFDAIISDVPTLAAIMSRFGAPPLWVLRRLATHDADPVHIATTLQCTVEQVERWLTLVSAAPIAPVRASSRVVPSAPRLEKPSVQRAGTLKSTVAQLLGSSLQAQAKLASAGSLSALHRSLQLNVPYLSFYGAIRSLYGSGFVGSVPRQPKPKNVAPPKRQTSSALVARLESLLGPRDEVINRLNATGSAAALLIELKLEESYPTFTAALRKVYGADILSTIVRPTRATAGKSTDRAPALTSGMGRGAVVQTIANAYSQTRDWVAVARRLNTTQDRLRELVNINPADFAGSISSDALRVLLHKERRAAPPHTLPPPEPNVPDLLLGQVRHPSGITLSKEVASGLEVYLRSLNVTEVEFFTDYYDSNSALEVAEAVGTSIEVLEHIATYYTTAAAEVAPAP